MFEPYYETRFGEIFGEPLKPADGLGAATVQRLLAKRKLTIPLALADYYAVAGRHWINTNHKELFAIKKLQWDGDTLVFMDENQWVVSWGVREQDLTEDNPIVWQRSNTENAWYAMKYRLSQFLMATWNWTMTGTEEPPQTD